MAGEEQYYNPIVQAMIHSRQLQMEGSKLEFDKEKAKQEQEARKIQLQQQLKQIEYEHQHQTESTRLQSEMQNLHHEIAKINAIKDVNKAATEGVNPQSMLGQFPELLKGMQATDFSTPQAEAQRVQGLAQAQSSGAAQGALPAQKELEKFQQGNRKELLGVEHQNKKDLVDLENKFKENIVNKEITSKEKLANLERGTQLAISNATNATHLKVAGMQYTPSPENLRSMVVAGLTGGQLNFTNPQERAALGTIGEMGGRSVSKEDIQALKQAQQMIPLFDRLEKFADKLPDSAVVGAVKGAGIKAANAIGYSTDTQNELNQIKSQAINVGKTIEGLTGGRITNQQISLALDAITAPNITKKQALDRLQNLKDLLINKQENTIMGGMPEFQKELIYKVHGIKPSFLIGKPDTLPNGAKLDTDASISQGHAVYGK